MATPGFLSKRVKKKSQTGLTTDRYEFLGLDQAEPDLGDPLVGLSSVGANPPPISGNQYVLTAYENQTGRRYWTAAAQITGSGLIPGSFTVFDNNVQVGAANSFNRFNFVGNGVSVDPVSSDINLQTGIATVRITVSDVVAPGDLNSIPYKASNGFLAGATDFVYSSGNIGIGTTIPTVKLDVVGNVRVSGVSTLGVTTTTNLTSQQLNVSGISTLGVTTTTNLTSQQLNVSGISTLGVTSTTNLTTQQLNVSGISTLGITTITNLTSQQLNVSGITTVGFITATNLTTQQLNVSGISTLGVTSTTNLTTQQLYVSGITTVGFITATNLYVAGVGTFQSSNLKVVGASTSFQYSIAGGAIAADRTLNLPVITGTDTVATLGLTQSFTGTVTFSGSLSVTSANITHTATTNSFTAGSYTTGTVIIGGTSQTGAITLGRATTSQTLNLAAGASGIGTTKTINFGTAGLTSSFTQINIGPIAGVGTVVINSGTNLLVGTTTATETASQRLQVSGGAYVSGNLGIGTTNPRTPLQVETYGVKTGVGTFTASVGVSTTLDSFSVSSTDFKIAEYTVHIGFGSSIQAQKVLVTQDQSTAYSQEYGVVYNNSLLVSIGATVSGGNCILQATPQTGVSGLTTYRFARNTLL